MCLGGICFNVRTTGPTPGTPGAYVLSCGVATPMSDRQLKLP